MATAGVFTKNPKMPQSLLPKPPSRTSGRSMAESDAWETCARVLGGVGRPRAEPSMRHAAARRLRFPVSVETVEDGHEIAGEEEGGNHSPYHDNCQRSLRLGPDFRRD